MKTLNKQQLYKFVKNRGACHKGLKRLRYHMKTKTAQEIINLYRNCYIEQHTYKGRVLASDYQWVCNSIGLSYCYIPSVKDIVNKINEWNNTWGRY